MAKELFSMGVAGFMKVTGLRIRGMDKALKYSRMVTALLVNMILAK